MRFLAKVSWVGFKTSNIAIALQRGIEGCSDLHEPPLERGIIYVVSDGSSGDAQDRVRRCLASRDYNFVTTKWDGHIPLDGTAEAVAYLLISLIGLDFVSEDDSPTGRH